jgi:hypothetical protein
LSPQVQGQPEQQSKARLPIKKKKKPKWLKPVILTAQEAKTTKTVVQG